MSLFGLFSRKSRYNLVSDTKENNEHENNHLDDEVTTSEFSQYQSMQKGVRPQRSGNGSIGPHSSFRRSSDCFNTPREPGACTICVYFVRQNFPTVVIVILLSVIFAMAGDRASSIGQDSQLKEDTRKTDKINWRPCQIYANGHVGEVEVLQTSLGTPNSHWSPLPCLIRGKYELQWHFGTGGVEPIDYGRPSAEIKVEPYKLAHPDREEILGFGGAFTEATALNYMSLSEAGRSAVMDLLFGNDGLGYSLGRVHINSCDFSEKSYSFDDMDGDFDLLHFDMDVSHDVRSGMMEMMLKANKISLEHWLGEGNHGMRIIASPWSPPAWMKKPTKNDDPGVNHSERMIGSAEPNCLRDGTGVESRYARAWALYFVKFISAYKNLGLDLFAVTVQNEPEFAAPWEACSYTAGLESSFIANHLGPQLRAHHPDIKLLVFDHNKDHAPHWTDIIMNQSSSAAEFVDGTALHWYAGGMDRLLDGAVGQPNMHRLISKLKTLDAKPNHLVLGSEACHCPSTGYAGGDLSVAWSRAERYAHTILADLAAGSNGWVEWNLVLDAIGGPNHLLNVCDSPLLAVPYRADGAYNVTELPHFEHSNFPYGPVIGDSKTREELNAHGYPAEYLDVGVVVQPMYYYMGHISRHVRPGSRPVRALTYSSAHGPKHRTFLHHLKSRKTLAGGGINDLARKGVEVTLWPCEGSSRQQWKLNDVGNLQVFGNDWKGKPTIFCIGKEPDDSFKGLVLADCDHNAGLFKIKEIDNLQGGEGEETKLINFIFENSKDAEGNSYCLVILPLENDGGAYGPLGGAQVTIGNCIDTSAVWSYNIEKGEISSHLFSSNVGGEDVCLTTGWPFLQVGAFSKESRKTVIILNEASEPANYILRHEGKVFMTNSIPAHSIQTINYDVFLYG